MKIESSRPSRTLASRGKPRSAAPSSAGFASELRGQGPSARTVPGRPVSAVEALVAIQSTLDGAEPRSPARKRGQLLLDELDGLRDALLLGRVPLSRLERLGALVARQRQSCADPGLDRILDEIELRAAVELAKLGR
jgi:hypothetical protein